MLKKILSSGQSGVDRAALNIVIRVQIGQISWYPKCRRAQFKVIDEKLNKIHSYL
jgi:hypothetical protein